MGIQLRSLLNNFIVKSCCIVSLFRPCFHYKGYVLNTNVGMSDTIIRRNAFAILILHSVNVNLRAPSSSIRFEMRGSICVDVCCSDNDSILL